MCNTSFSYDRSQIHLFLWLHRKKWRGPLICSAKFLCQSLKKFPLVFFFPLLVTWLIIPLCYSMCTIFTTVYRVKNNQKWSAVELLHVALEKVLHVVRALLNYEVFYFFSPSQEFYHWFVHSFNFFLALNTNRLYYNL